MKKIIIIGLALCILASVFGCADNKSAKRSKELKTLDLDEFDFYEDGKLAFKIDETEEYSPGEYVFLISSKRETKRGVTVGSSAKDIAEQYKGFRAYFGTYGSDFKDEDFYDFYNKKIKKALRFFGIYDSKISIFYTTYVVDDKLYDFEAFCGYLEERGTSYNKYLDNDNNYLNIKIYMLRFNIKNNKVEFAGIGMWCENLSNYKIRR